MLKKFALVGLSGLVICGVCMATAAALGGKALRASGLDIADLGGNDFLGVFSDRPSCDFDDSDTQGSRSVAWNGGDSVKINLPANVHYRPGAGDQVIITGDSNVLPHVRIRNGSIRLDCRGDDSDDRLEITLPGRLFNRFELAGTGSLTLDAIDQPSLKLSVAGAGSVQANGKTDNLDIEMAGASEAKLGALAAGNVKLEMAGANHAEIAPRDDLKVEIAGVGDVKLLTEPHTIKSEIAGAGHIIHPDQLDKSL